MLQCLLPFQSGLPLPKELPDNIASLGRGKSGGHPQPEMTSGTAVRRLRQGKEPVIVNQVKLVESEPPGFMFPSNWALDLRALENVS